MPAFKTHKTATVDKPWDGPLNKGRAKLGQGHDYYGKIFAWFDPEGDPTLKQTYRFIHHEVDAAGTGCAADGVDIERQCAAAQTDAVAGRQTYAVGADVGVAAVGGG